MKTQFYFWENPITIQITIIILICGLIGGIGNSLREETCNKAIIIKNIFLGVIAALTVPLFLNLLSSDILKNIYSDEKNVHVINYLIFSGFCVVASFSSLNFFNTISGRVLQNLKEEIKVLKSDNETLKETNKRLDNNINAITPITTEKITFEAQDIEKFKNPAYKEIITSIKTEDNKFKPQDAVKNEVGLDNREVEKKIEILKENNLVKEVVSGEGEKAVALTEKAEQILSSLEDNNQEDFSKETKGY